MTQRTSTPRESAATAALFVAVLAVLLTTGWSANHFAAVLPVLTSDEHLSETFATVVFGVYAIGLLPGLFGGGALSDRYGRAAVALPGAVCAFLGSLILAFWETESGLVVGRLVVGVGAGLAIGTCTAWAADLRGPRGTVLAGVFLTLGFGLGPVVSGMIEQIPAVTQSIPFLTSAVLSAVAITTAVVLTLAGRPRSSSSTAGSNGPLPAGAPPAGAPPAGPLPAGPASAETFASVRPVEEVRSAASALGWALPLAPWVFATVTVAFVFMPSRLHAGADKALWAGIAAGVALGTGIVVQTLARGRGWGPRTGVIGLVVAAVGFVVVGLSPRPYPEWLLVVCAMLLGGAYGLCLREGLLDLESLAPQAVRGTLTGVFYVGTYVGFVLPLVLVSLDGVTGVGVPLVILAVVALLIATLRHLRLRPPTPHPRAARPR